MVDLWLLDWLTPAAFLALSAGLLSCGLSRKIGPLLIAKVHQSPVIKTCRPTHGGMGDLGRGGRACLSVGWMHCLFSVRSGWGRRLEKYKRCFSVR